MDWNENKSIQLSQNCVIIFMILLAIMDVCGFWFAPYFIIRTRSMQFSDNKTLLFIIIYCLSVFGWILLISLYKLLRNMKRGIVFDRMNVKELRYTSWCCFGACVISLPSTAYYLPFVVIAIAAGFMGLIVRIVKNTFEQAIAMKEELDFTV